MTELKHLDLFSGIGGFALGLSWAGGFETVAFCEQDDFCQRVLRKHWPDVPIYNDVETIDYDGPVDIITAGFPCQPFSSAGRRGGADDDRYLWPETLAAVKRYKPDWFIGENVAGLTSMGFPAGEPEMESRGATRFQDHDHYEALYTYTQRMCLDHICEDLEQVGYEVIPFVIPAAGIGAPHRRDRVWIVGHAEQHKKYGKRGDSRLERESVERMWETLQQKDRSPDTDGLIRSGQAMADADSPGSLSAAYSGICGIEEGTGSRDAQSEQRSSYVANAAEEGLQNRRGASLGQPGAQPEPQRQCGGHDVPQPDSQRSQGQRPDDTAQGRENARGPSGLCGGERHWATEPDVGRVAHGVPDRVDRLKGLGNAVVPQIPMILGQAIQEVT